MPEQKGQEMVVSGERGAVPDIFSADTSGYRQEIILAIDQYRDKLDDQDTDRNRIKNRLRLLQLKERAYNSENLPDIERELWTMAVDIEEPTLRMQRNISLIILAYTIFAFLSFVVLTVTDAIMLPSFNIPYSVLLMGLIGCLVSMFVKLPNIRVREPLSHDSILWFVISPPVAVIMAGIFFGIVQIFLPVIEVDLSDESWFFWILAWAVGFFNWVYLYEKISGGIKRSVARHNVLQSEKSG